VVCAVDCCGRRVNFDDPRYGKTTYQLTNVQLTEPARSLFERLRISR